MRQSRPDSVLPRLYTFALWKKKNNLNTLFFLKFGIASERKRKTKQIWYSFRRQYESLHGILIGRDLK